MPPHNKIRSLKTDTNLENNFGGNKKFGDFRSKFLIESKFAMGRNIYL